MTEYIPGLKRYPCRDKGLASYRVKGHSISVHGVQVQVCVESSIKDTVWDLHRWADYALYIKTLIWDSADYREVVS